jgi:hypothetical protein
MSEREMKQSARPDVKGSLFVWWKFLIQNIDDGRSRCAVGLDHANRHHAANRPQSARALAI